MQGATLDTEKQHSRALNQASLHGLAAGVSCSAQEHKLVHVLRLEVVLLVTAAVRDSCQAHPQPGVVTDLHDSDVAAGNRGGRSLNVPPPEVLQQMPGVRDIRQGEPAIPLQKQRNGHVAKACWQLRQLQLKYPLRDWTKKTTNEARVSVRTEGADCRITTEVRQYVREPTHYIIICNALGRWQDGHR